MRDMDMPSTPKRRIDAHLGEEMTTAGIRLRDAMFQLALEIEQSLGLQFNNKALLIQAVTHRSYLNEHPAYPLGHNERLEYMGDAVLNLVVTEHLFRTYPLPEGHLAQMKSLIVSTNALTPIAQALGLERWLLRAQGEERIGQLSGRKLEDALEALIAVIYLDQGLQVAQEFIHQHVVSRIPRLLLTSSDADPKTRLQELAQRYDHATPTYQVLALIGPAHDQQFTVGVFLHTKELAKGVGRSKKAAQEAAAKEALKQYSTQSR